MQVTDPGYRVTGTGFQYKLRKRDFFTFLLTNSEFGSRKRTYRHFPGYKVPFFKVTRLQGYKVPGYKVTRLQGYRSKPKPKSNLTEVEQGQE